jgi:hypothetical protein
MLALGACGTPHGIGRLKASKYLILHGLGRTHSLPDSRIAPRGSLLKAGTFLLNCCHKAKETSAGQNGGRKGCHSSALLFFCLTVRTNYWGASPGRPTFSGGGCSPRDVWQKCSPYTTWSTMRWQFGQITKPSQVTVVSTLQDGQFRTRVIAGQSRKFLVLCMPTLLSNCRLRRSAAS